MEGLVKPLKALAIITIVLAIFLSISIFAARDSLSLWCLLAIVFLPLAFWFRLGFKKWGITFLFIAATLAISPLDFAIQHSGRRGVRVLPISYGYACPSGTVCYGCIVPPHPARKVLVLSY